MGWKNLKEHYRIGHAVCVTKEGICIGSPYIHNLIVIGLDGSIIKADDGRVNEDLRRYMTEMKADPKKLREVVQAPDIFTASITVYTYDGGNIIEKKCEQPGWPNVTHDGDMMYENTYSTDKRKIVKWAKENAQAGIKWKSERVEEIKNEPMNPESKRKREIARIRRRYTRVVKYGKVYSAYLQIDHQCFCVASGTDKDDVNWYRDQLAIALERLMRQK